MKYYNLLYLLIMKNYKLMNKLLNSSTDISYIYNKEHRNDFTCSIFILIKKIRIILVLMLAQVMLCFLLLGILNIIGLG